MSETISYLMLDALNLENRMDEYESNLTAYLHLAMGLAKDVSNIEVNLSEYRSDITYQEDVLIALNESIKQMNSVQRQLNTSSLIDTTKLNDLEAEMEQQLNQMKLEIATNHEHIEYNIGAIRLLEGNISSLKTAYGILRLNLTSLEAATVTTNDAVQDNYDGIATLFTNIEALNGSSTDTISRLSIEYSGFKGTYFFYRVIMLFLLSCYVMTGNLSDNSQTFNYVFERISQTGYNRRQYELISKFNVGLKTLLREGLSEPEFYDDLVYKFKKLLGGNDFLFSSEKKSSDITDVYYLLFNLNAM